jgi:cell division protein FtsI (penicillin-binding protein 3)
MDIKKNILLRTRIGFIALFSFSLLIIGKLIYIQFLQGKEWKSLAHAETIEYRPIKPIRGNIYAQDESLLCTSLPFYQVALDPSRSEDSIFNSHVAELSTLLSNFYKDRSAKDYQNLLYSARKSGKKYILLNTRQINYHEKKVMSGWPLFREGRLKGGVIFEKIERRFRPFQDLAARTIGFINDNKQGVGLEYSFDSALHGVDGNGLFQKMTGGSWKMIPSNSTQKPIHGVDLITTIDINLQDIAHTSLLKALQQSNANYGVTIVMEVATGAIKAMVNLGKVGPLRYQEIYNYAVGDQGNTEPGSAFKLIAMMALLEETNFPLSYKVDTGGGAYQFYDLTMHDTKAEGFGVITLEEVFAKSSNIGLAKLVDSAFSAKPQRFIDYIQKLALDKPLGFQLQGEAKPFIKTPKHPAWTKVTLPWMSMGYEMKLSPLQLLTVYNAVANNGVMVQPFLVKRIQNANVVVQHFEPSIINKKICSKATLKKLQAMLESVVAHGTASKFRHGFYKIAGKSGTSNKLEKGKYGNATYASFAGYFPADNPRYSCMVVIDNPQGVQHHFGGQVAAPVVKEIADKLSARDLIAAPCIQAAKKGSLEANTLPTYIPLQAADCQTILRALGISRQLPIQAHRWLQFVPIQSGLTWQNYDTLEKGDVPKVVGMTLRDALYILENKGLPVHTVGPLHGYVKSQLPEPGTAIGNHVSIALILA